MGLLITKGGLMDTIQDDGRWGFSNWGVNTGGASDPFSAKVANLLLDNPSDEPMLELHFPCFQATFQLSCWIAIAGADFSPTLNGFPIPLNKPVFVEVNDKLIFNKHKNGSRAYLAVKGGFNFPEWLASSSTNLRLPGLGLLGRRLKEGDFLSFKNIHLTPKSKETNTKWTLGQNNVPEDTIEIEVLPGREWDVLEENSKSELQHSPFTILPQSDRMGCRLLAKPLILKNKIELISTGVRKGTVQLLPSGQLIVLMADHQTTGGYPRLLEVVSAAFPKMAQLKQGDQFRFKLVHIDAAEKKMFDQQTVLNKIKWACHFIWNQ
jgi:antagonist of KipI